MLVAAGTNAGLSGDVIGLPASMFVPIADTVNVPLPAEGVPLVIQFSSLEPLKTDIVVADVL